MGGLAGERVLNISFQPPELSSRSDTPTSSESLKIVLIEDHLPDAELLRIAFRRDKGLKSMQLIHFEALKPAISFLEKNSADLIILDLSLPDSSGMASLNSLKEVVPHLPIIVWTGWDDRNSAIDGIRSGAQDYLFKGSIDYGSLFSTINYAIERQKVQNAVENISLRRQQETEFKREVLEVVAHDLRSPLTGVIMQLEGILNGQLIKHLTPEQRKLFLQMRSNCEQVFELSSGLLDLESLKSKDFLRVQQVDIVPYLRKTFDSFLPVAASKAIHLDLEIGENLRRVLVDPKRLAQVLNNLMSNAIKFSHPKTKITVRAFMTAESFVLSVQDQGQGIPDEDKSKLFLEFSRTRIRPTAGEESAGLGLAIVKLIADAHGGQVSVDTELDVGSTFSISIPNPR